MYLTRFRFNTSRPGARKLLSSPQATHAAVMAGFPHILPSDDEAPRVLWRVDRNASAEVFLYVVSPDRPDYTHLVEQAGWPTTENGWQTRDYEPFLTKLAHGDTWAFRLTANPVHHVRNKDGAPTKATAHLTPHHQMRWLLQRQETAGFEVLVKPLRQRRSPEGDEYELSVRDRHMLQFRKRKDNRGKHPVKLATVTFDGRLRVTDAEALRRTLTTGLGRAKAYGCGLLTLAPIPRAAT